MGAVKVLNQLEFVGETIHRALNVLATVAPEWLRSQVSKSGSSVTLDAWMTIGFPKTERDRLNAIIGDDGSYLLN